MHSKELPTAAGRVGAHWCAAPPWLHDTRSVDPDVDTTHGRLWRAATDTFASATAGISYRALAEATAEAARTSEGTAEWLESTRRILRAESMIELDRWRHCPAGIAIQLVLARPTPAKFKTWLRDMPGMPPAIWWSAAILCGLLTGYRNLERKFRGAAAIQESLTVHAFRTCGGNKAISWPSVSGKPNCSYRGDDFVLTWGEREVAQLSAQNRSKWLNADLDSPEMMLAATRLAKRLEWPCLGRQIVLRKPCRLTIDKADIGVESDVLNVIRPTALNLPRDISDSDVVIEDTLDVERFRQLLVVGPGRISEPPPAVRFTVGTSDAENEFRGKERVADAKVAILKTSNSIQRDMSDIAGLVYMTDFLSENEEQRLLGEIDRSPWSEELQRRVQHYGWRYN